MIVNTDSPALSGYLHRTQFTGEGVILDDGLHIRFHEIEHYRQAAQIA